MHTDKLIVRNIPLHDKNWFATGGAAEYYAAPETALEFQEAVRFAQTENKIITVLGQGANCLISDSGIKGLVIQPKLHRITFSHNDLVTADAGATMHELIEACLNHNLIGLEEFSGIPGTVGGSVFINLHYFEFLLSQFLVSAQVMHKQTGDIMEVDNAWFSFGYNASTLQHAPYYLINATFKLKQADELGIAHARGRAQEIIRHRFARYPSKNTCGSFFRNFLPEEVTLESNDKKMIYVAYYLDKIGVKGCLEVGDAIVSHQHANMIVNRGNATTNDIIRLARTMQTMVKKEFGITPQPECRLLGFDEYPLIR
jgi:UDP-N-acetylmuramate dehydrogenase